MIFDDAFLDPRFIIIAHPGSCINTSSDIDAERSIEEKRFLYASYERHIDMIFSPNGYPFHSQLKEHKDDIPSIEIQGYLIGKDSDGRSEQTSKHIEIPFQH